MYMTLLFSQSNKPKVVRSDMPFGFDESPLDIQELIKFRDSMNGDLNASLQEIKIGWKNHFSWRPDVMRNTKRLFSTRKTYIDDPINFASLLQIGLDLSSVKKVVDYILDLSSKKVQFDAHLHYQAAEEYISELEVLKAVAVKKEEKMKPNKKFIQALDVIINKFKSNLKAAYPTQPMIKSQVELID